MTDRDWGVAVLAVRDDRVLLHHHAGLNRWLPPGGHIDPNETPDEAAIREVLEETGVNVMLIDDPVIAPHWPGSPQMLTRPLGIMLVDIQPGHQHIDLIYLARATNEGDERAHWFTHEQLASLDITNEIRAWCISALTRAAI
jgi:8-oxo-dGTP pyrophosphatase MutT (NUDIX family)